MMKGLAYLHDEFILPNGQRRSLAHRDIKSKNILIKDDMTAAVADFGLAQCFTDGQVDESHAQVFCRNQISSYLLFVLFFYFGVFLAR